MAKKLSGGQDENPILGFLRFLHLCRAVSMPWIGHFRPASYLSNPCDVLNLSAGADRPGIRFRCLLAKRSDWTQLPEKRKNLDFWLVRSCFQVQTYFAGKRPINYQILIEYLHLEPLSAVQARWHYFFHQSWKSYTTRNANSRWREISHFELFLRLVTWKIELSGKSWIGNLPSDHWYEPDWPTWVTEAVSSHFFYVGLKTQILTPIPLNHH